MDRSVLMMSISRRWFAILTAAVAIGGTSALFQNCTEGRLAGDASISSVAQSLSLAYDAHFDQLAYMSCSALQAGNYDQSAYFTFRAGAYRSGGVSLNSSFVAATKNMPLTDRIAALSMSKVNSQTAMQASLRSLSNFEQLYVANGSNPVAGQDYWNFFALLGQSQVSSALALASPNTIRLEPGAAPGDGRFEADLQFGLNDTLANNIRLSLQNGFMLALTYVGGTDQSATASSATYAKAPVDSASANSVYGKGLIVHFRQPAFSGINSSYMPGALNDITEVNLVNRTDSTGFATWSCPTSFEFRIVRAADIATAGCVAQPDPDPLNNDLAVIRRSLRTEDWYVDMSNHCIVPKKPIIGTDCYGTAPAVQYGLSSQCGAIGLPCTQFASVCYRNQ